MSLLRYLPRFKRAYQSFSRLDDMRTWPRHRIESFQLDRINWLWPDAVQNVPYYRDLAREHDLPISFSSLVELQERVPLLEKGTVRDQSLQLKSQCSESGRWLRTGGSTGVPTSVFWSHQAHFENLQLRYAWINRFGVDVFDRQGFIWGHAGSFAPGLRGFVDRLRQPILNKLRNRVRYDAYKLGAANLDEYLLSIQSHAPVSLYGYSSAILLLANRALEKGFEFDCLKLIILTGEATTDEDRVRIELAFNAPARIEYGSVECGIIALESDQRKIEVQENSRMVETIPRDDGNFEFAVTVLDNPGFPLFRFLIGDTSGRSIDNRAGGFALLADVQGRSNDFLIAKDGQLVHANAVKHAMENATNVARFQAVQELDGSLKLLIETGHSDSEIMHAAAVTQISSLLGGFTVEPVLVEKISGTLAGKHRWVVSRLYEEYSRKVDTTNIT